MILSVNSDPSAGYYTFLIEPSGSRDSQKFVVNAHHYLTVSPQGNSPWKVTAYNDDNPEDISETWHVSNPEALLTTANDVQSYPQR